MNRSFKIFVACALGGGVGSFVALQFTSHFWFLGLIFGGAVGYFSYDLNAVVAAVREAWGKVIGFSLSKKSIFDAIPLLTVVIFLGLILWISMRENNGQPALIGKRIQVGIALLFFFSLFSAIPKAFSADREARKKGANFTESEEAFSKTLALYFNPLAIFSVTPVWGLWQCLKCGAKFLAFCWRLCKYYWPFIPIALITLGKFTWMIFILIHSEIRLLCMLDAAIGAGIGYFLDSALIGALAGGAFGVFNYQVITKWWLKLAPANK
jgi:hypothetical protein